MAGGARALGGGGSKVETKRFHTSPENYKILKPQKIGEYWVWVDVSSLFPSLGIFKVPAVSFCGCDIKQEKMPGIEFWRPFDYREVRTDLFHFFIPCISCTSCRVYLPVKVI